MRDHACHHNPVITTPKSRHTPNITFPYVATYIVFFKNISYKFRKVEIAWLLVIEILDLIPFLLLSQPFPTLFVTSQESCTPYFSDKSCAIIKPKL